MGGPSMGVAAGAGGVPPLQSHLISPPRPCHNPDCAVCSKAQELIHVPEAIQSGIQVIKRFSGGGTVVVDENTVFATLIFQVRTLL